MSLKSHKDLPQSKLNQPNKTDTETYVVLSAGPQSKSIKLTMLFQVYFQVYFLYD